MHGARRKMDITVTFLGGPGAIAGMKIKVDMLPEVKAFFDEHDKQVFVYRRDPIICELCYIYDHALSKGLSRDYEKAKALFTDLQPANLKLDETKPIPAEVTEPSPGTFRIGDTVQGGTGLDDPPQDDEDE